MKQLYYYIWFTVISVALAGCGSNGLQLEPGTYIGMGRQYKLEIKPDSTFLLENVIGEKTSGYWRVQQGELLLLPEIGQTDFLTINYVSKDSLNLGFNKGVNNIGFKKNKPLKYLTDSAFLVKFLKNGRLRYNSFFNEDPFEVHSIEFLDNGQYLYDNFYVFQYEIKTFNDGVFLLMIHDDQKVPFMLASCSNIHADFKTYSLEKEALVNSTIKPHKPSDPGKTQLLKKLLHGTWGVLEDPHKIFDNPDATLTIDTAGQYRLVDGPKTMEGNWFFNRTADVLVCDATKEPFVIGIRYFDRHRVIIDFLNADSGKIEGVKIKRMASEPIL